MLFETPHYAMPIGRVTPIDAPELTIYRLCVKNSGIMVLQCKEHGKNWKDVPTFYEETNSTTKN